MDPVEILRVLGNKYNAEILQSTYSPKSAQELSDELDIPIATSYRRIEELTENNLLELDGREVSDEGRHTKVYRRKFDAVHFEFNEGDIDLELIDRSESNSIFVDMWSKVANWLNL